MIDESQILSVVRHVARECGDNSAKLEGGSWTILETTLYRNGQVRTQMPYGGFATEAEAHNLMENFL